MIDSLRTIIQSLSKTQRIIFWLATAVLCVSLVLFIGRSISRNTILAPAAGGEHSEGIVGQPTSINPILAATEADKALTNLLFADLITLSKSYSTSSLGRIWTVTLKDDLEWSDGKAITTSDVLFTVNTMQNADSGSVQLAQWQGVTVERVSEREVRFILKTPYAYFLDNLKQLRIAPAHIFEAIPITNLRLSNYNFEPVGSGAYVYTSFEKEKNGFISRYFLTANPRYAGGQPLIKNFTLKFFESYNDAITDFNHKGIDALGGIDAASAGDLKVNHQLYELSVPRYYAVFINQGLHPALKDAQVRAALSRAVDRTNIINVSLSGHALPQYGPVVSKLYSSSTLYAGEYTSTEEAARILENAKWLVGNDGVRAKTVGKTTQRLAFDLKVPALPFLVAAAEQLKADWEKIGVAITVSPLSPEEIHDGFIKSRTYQLLLFGNTLRGSSDIYSFWHSSQRSFPGLNLSLYSNKTVDAELERLRSVFDPAIRASSLEKIEQSILADRPAIFLFSPTYLYAAPHDLGGLPTENIETPDRRFDNVHTWFLNTERIFR